MTTTETAANERVALLLGWKRTTTAGFSWVDPNGRLHYEPDFAKWASVPEMLRFIEGLRFSQCHAIAAVLTRMSDSAVTGRLGVLQFICETTPTILRDAIDEVCG